jgi:hypothetical protein
MTFANFCQLQPSFMSIALSLLFLHPVMNPASESTIYDVGIPLFPIDLPVCIQLHDLS